MFGGILNEVCEYFMWHVLQNRLGENCATKKFACQVSEKMIGDK